MTDGQYKLQRTHRSVTPTAAPDDRRAVMNISEPFIRRPIATTLLMAALAFVGIVSFPFLPVAPLPQVDFPTIQVTATWPGASAETMASSVAAPLERQFGQIAGVTQLTSQSSLGATTIVIQFDLDRNIDSAAQDVQAAITVASKNLPQAMTTPPSYKKVNPADSPILMLSARSDTMPLIKVDDYADIFLAQQISQMPGVAQVSIFGDQKPSIRVQVDPAKLASSGLTLEDIRSTLVTSTTNSAKGAINSDKISFTIAANDQIIDAKKFNDVVLAYRNGAPIRVRDVGQAISARSTAPSRLIRTTRTASSLPCSSSRAPMSSIRSTTSRHSCRCSRLAFRRRSTSTPSSIAPRPSAPRSLTSSSRWR